MKKQKQTKRVTVELGIPELEALEASARRCHASLSEAINVCLQQHLLTLGYKWDGHGWIRPERVPA